MHSSRPFLIFVLLMGTACGTKVDPMQDFDMAAFGDSLPQVVSYETLKPILAKRCFSCHASTVQGAARQGANPGVDYDTYPAAVKYGPSGNSWVQGGGMPPGAPLPMIERATFQAWIDAGMPSTSSPTPGLDAVTPSDGTVTPDNNTLPDTATLDDITNPYPDQATYQSLRPLLKTRCFACHASTVQGAARLGAPVGVDYDTYPKAVQYGPSGNAWVQSDGMPPYTPMPAPEKAQFQAWIDNGMPENPTIPPDPDAITPDVITGDTVGPPPVKTTYWQLRPTLVLNCLECHSSTVVGLARQGAPRGVDYDTYLTALKYSGSGNAWVQAGNMPIKAPLTATEKALFQAWIDSGVPEGTPADAGATP